MLTTADIVDYIKRSISFLPYIDISDEDILDHVKRFALREFSKYSRLKQRTIIDTNNDWFKTPENHIFKFYDKKQRNILNISGVSLTTIYGDPQPIFSGETIASTIDWLMAKTLQNTVKTILDYEYWEYIPHNKIRINRFMQAGQYVGIDYECSHLITEIPDQYETIFLELSSAYCKEWVANMRIDTISTPFGEINVNSSELRAEAKTTIDDFKERSRKQPPNLYIYKG